jgi:hypothetical protein
MIMRWVKTFLVTGMQGVIQEEYIYIVDSVQTTSEKPVKFWVYKSDDLPNVIILNHRQYACEDKVYDIIQKHWATCNVFVTVKKVASTMIEDANAIK